MIDNIEHEIIKKKIFIPDINIRTDQLNSTNKVCPMSGWAANNKTINNVIKKENKYFK